MLLIEHRRTHQDRQDKVRVHTGKVIHPHDPFCTLQLDRVKKNTIDRKEYRDLQKKRQTTAERIGTVFLIGLHHRRVHTLRIAFIFGLDLFDLGSDLFHLLHREHSFVCQREKYHTDQECQRDYRPTPVAEDTVQPHQYLEKRRCRKCEPAVFDRIGKHRIDLLKYFVVFWPDIAIESKVFRAVYIDNRVAVAVAVNRDCDIWTQPVNDRCEILVK